jgi:hypothetical protein
MGSLIKITGGGSYIALCCKGVKQPAKRQLLATRGGDGPSMAAQAMHPGLHDKVAVTR